MYVLKKPMSDDAYSMKEMVQELRAETKQQSIALATIASTLDDIEAHLKRLNGQVATHTSRWTDYDIEHAKNAGSLRTIKGAWGAIWAIIGVFGYQIISKFL